MILTIITHLILYSIGIFWTIPVLFRCIVLLITKPRKFLAHKNRTRPAVLKAPEYGTHGMLHLKDDVKIHYVASGDPNKPLMLLLHGFPEFWYSWRHQIKAFNNTYRVVAIDLKGYGESSKPSAVSEYTVSSLVEDVKQVIPALGYNSCIAVGHDWGGAITWALAAKYPDLVTKAVVLNCPHPGAFGKVIRTSWKQFMKSWYMFLVNLPYIPELFFSSGDKKQLDNAFTGKYMGAKAGSFTEEDMEAFKYNFNYVSDFTGPMNYIRAALRYGLLRPAPKESKKIIEVPLLLVWGTRDGALDTEMAPLSQKYVKNFTLKYVEGASHWVQQDEPEIVNQHIKDFLVQ